MAEVMLVVALNGKSESSPIRIYKTGSAVLPVRFVLRMDACVNQNGVPSLKLGNFKLGLIGTHESEYLAGKLEGFRRSIGDSTFIICKRFTEETPTIKSLEAVEAF